MPAARSCWRWRRGGSTVTRTIDRREVQEGRPVHAALRRSAVCGRLPVQVEALGPTARLAPPGRRPGADVDRPPGRARPRTVAAAAVRRPRPVLAAAAARPARVAAGPARARAAAAAAPARRQRDRRGDPEPDGLRPYTPGTPISRVHWASAARGGELQERHFITGRDQLPLVVVDTTGRGRGGAGLGGALRRRDRAGARPRRRLPRAAARRPRARRRSTTSAAGPRSTAGWPRWSPACRRLRRRPRRAARARGRARPWRSRARGALPPGVVALHEWAAA